MTDETCIRAYALPGLSLDVAELIRPAQVRRKWMSATPEKYAYRCIPLSAANSMGWEILNPVRAEIVWDGGIRRDNLHIDTDHDNPLSAKSHFGSGIVSFYLPFLFQTPPTLGMVCTAPANHDKNGIEHLEAFIRTDWLPNPFAMSWRMTAKDTPVVFEAGEPIARVYPYPITLLGELDFEIHELASNPELEDKSRIWGIERAKANEASRRASEAVARGEKPDTKGVWHGLYARGFGAKDDAELEHMTRFICKPPVDRR